MDVAVCPWQRDFTCPEADSEDMTTPLEVALGQLVTSWLQRFEFGFDERHPGKLCALLCTAATPAPSSMRRWDWSATHGRRTTPVLTKWPWRRSTACHHARRLIVLAAWGSAAAMPPSTWWRRYVATNSGHSRRVRPAAWKPWCVPLAQVDGRRRVLDNRANQPLLTDVYHHADVSRLLNELVDE